MDKDYDVIIIGAGPVGLALGIELGLQGINTLILEKYYQPPITPRAQSLSARTMEFFLRWQIDRKLEQELLLPRNYPAKGIWCSSLTGKVYYNGLWGDNELASGDSAKKGVRIPLWLTEKVLRQRLADFNCVDLLTKHEVCDIIKHDSELTLSCLDKETKVSKTFKTKYLACCDGANGLSKEKLNNGFQPLTSQSKILSISFIAKDLQSLKSIPDGMFYSVISEQINAFIWPIDLQTGFWVAQVIWEDTNDTPTIATLSEMLNDMAGCKFEKVISNYHFWNMQVKLADKFQDDNRIFWLGDSAHAFAPTGGLGLNTGMGDALNLGWKLAAVIKEQAPLTLLATYEVERRPVCIENLNFAKQNALNLLEIKKLYPPADDFEKFAQASANLGERLLKSSGLTLGYRYSNSPLTQSMDNQLVREDPARYQPKALPGYFLPHKELSNKTPIYSALSATNWNLLYFDEQDDTLLQGLPATHNFELNQLTILLGYQQIHTVKISESLYPYRLLLLRPDWHIATVANSWVDLLNATIDIQPLVSKEHRC